MESPVTMPATPECDKIGAIQERSQPMGEFIDWLLHGDYHICTMEEGLDGAVVFRPVYKNVTQWLAEMFDIDLDKVDEEKRAVLQYVRMQNTVARLEEMAE
jgi:hypothetical protein